jgi:hypothetical protein
MPVKQSRKHISKKPKRSPKLHKSKLSKNIKKSKRSLNLSKKTGKLKLVKIVKSPKPEKKYRAHFSDGTHTDFGAKGMSDFTKHKDPERKKRYMNRHSKRENWNSPKTPGALSRWILWNKDTLKKSIADYKKKFKL